MISDSIFQKAEPVRLTNGKFVDVIHGCYFEKDTEIIIQNGKILSIGNREEQAVKTSGTINLQGKTVIPGLINAHTHIQMVAPSIIYSFKMLNAVKKYQDAQIEKRMSDCLEHGVTIIRDCGTFYHPLSKNRDLKKRIETGKIPRPRILQCIIVNVLGNYMAESLGLIDYIMPLLGMSLKYSDPESSVIVFKQDASLQQVRDTVNRAIEERKADYIKLGEQSYNRLKTDKKQPCMSQEQMNTIVDEANRRGLKTTMHQVEVDSFIHGICAGVHSIAHIPTDRVLRPNEITMFMDSKSLIEPTLSGAYLGAWRIKNVAESSHPYIDMLMKYKDQTLPEVIKDYWITEFYGSIQEGINNINEGHYKKFMMPDMKPLLVRQLKGVVNWIENVKLLIEAGAISRMSIANDGGFFPVNDGNIDIELGMFGLCHELMERKFKGVDALRIATINSARSLGLETQFGSIEEGKTSDLAIIEGDPLDDFRCIGRKVSALFKDGNLVINHCNLKIDRSEVNDQQ
jgi:Imidazolonepropionase and related amidohydrolases